MGNQPSTTKEGGGHHTPRHSNSNSNSNSPRHHTASSSGPAAASASSSATHSRNTSSRAPISVHNHRAVAPAQASLAQAKGSTDITNSSALPITSLAASPVGSTRSGAGVAAAAPRPLESRHAPVRATPDSTPEAAPSKPVDVPNPSATSTGSTALQPVGNTSLSPLDHNETALHSHGSVSNMSFISRPPRLPLPIDEELHTPGSPIIAPADTDLGEPVESLDFEGEPLRRKTSNLSNGSSIDDDAEELRLDKDRPTVTTKLMWTRGGEKVYVTGTIFSWNRKQRLHPVEGRPGCFSVEIKVVPGTHHIRFLVDNEMQTSPDMPTTVDFGNNLVNYIEISPDHAVVPDEADVTATPTPAATPADEKRQLGQAEDGEEPPPRPYKQLPPPDAFSRIYPQYLRDFDEDESTPESKAKADLAVEAIKKLDTPPSLPGFLAKPILNAAVLMKDDNSVLNMPNHTTLNHLATSSIKSGTLAVSATTRYRDKYVTTIMYKPVVSPGSG